MMVVDDCKRSGGSRGAEKASLVENHLSKGQAGGQTAGRALQGGGSTAPAEPECEEGMLCSRPC